MPSQPVQLYQGKKKESLKTSFKGRARRAVRDRTEVSVLVIHWCTLLSGTSLQRQCWVYARPVLTVRVCTSLYSQRESAPPCTHSESLHHPVLTVRVCTSLYSQWESAPACTHSESLHQACTHSESLHQPVLTVSLHQPVLTVRVCTSLYSQWESAPACTHSEMYSQWESACTGELLAILNGSVFGQLHTRDDSRFLLCCDQVPATSSIVLCTMSYYAYYIIILYLF